MKKNFIILTLVFLLFSIITSSQPKIIDVSISTKNSQKTICLGQSIELFATVRSDYGTPSYEFKWDNCTYLNSCKGSQVTATPINTTIFRVWARIVGDPDTTWKLPNSPGIIEIIVHKPPILNILIPPKDTSRCINDPIQFLATAENYRNKPRWSATGNGYFVIVDSLPLAPVYHPAQGQTGVVTVTLTVDPLEYCSPSTFSKSVALTFVDIPSASIQTPDKTICSFEKFPITATAAKYTSFQWKRIGGTGNFSNANTLNPTYEPGKDDQGKTQIILEVRNSGCYVSDTVTITVIPMNLKPNPDPPSFCKGQSAQLCLSPAWNDNTYLWSTGAKVPCITIAPKQNTTYSVQVGNKLCTSGATNTITISVTVKETPVISKIVDDYAGKTIEILPDGYKAYAFFVNGNSEKDSPDNTFGYKSFLETADSICIRVTNDLNCVIDTCYLINDSIVVTAFTPNGDGINDRLLPGRHIVVFDRTQKVLYDGTDGWDGTFNGREMPIGTYFYVLYDRRGKIIYKGPVTLLRESLTK